MRRSRVRFSQAAPLKYRVSPTFRQRKVGLTFCSVDTVLGLKDKKCVRPRCSVIVGPSSGVPTHSRVCMDACSCSGPRGWSRLLLPPGALIFTSETVGGAALLSAHGWLKLRVAAEPKLKLMPLCEMSVGSRSWQSQCRGHTLTDRVTNWLKITSSKTPDRHEMNGPGGQSATTRINPHSALRYQTPNEFAATWHEHHKQPVMS